MDASPALHLWLLLHVSLAALPPILLWAHRRHWRISLFSCLVLLTLGAVAASWLAEVVRRASFNDTARFLLDTRTLLTATIVFVASTLITLLVWARRARKTGGG